MALTKIKIDRVSCDVAECKQHRDVVDSLNEVLSAGWMRVTTARHDAWICPTHGTNILDATIKFNDAAKRPGF